MNRTQCPICSKHSLVKVEGIEGRLIQSGHGYRPCDLYECNSPSCARTRVWGHSHGEWRPWPTDKDGRFITDDTGPISEDVVRFIPPFVDPSN